MAHLRYAGVFVQKPQQRTQRRIVSIGINKANFQPISSGCGCQVQGQCTTPRSPSCAPNSKNSPTAGLYGVGRGDPRLLRILLVIHTVLAVAGRLIALAFIPKGGYLLSRNRMPFGRRLRRHRIAGCINGSRIPKAILGRLSRVWSKPLGGFLPELAGI